MSETGRTLVLGVGQILMLDEGVGVRVAELLEANYEFPGSVEVIDSGTMGYGMMHLLRDVRDVIIIDAVDGTGHPPGTVVRLAPQDFAPNQVFHSLHDVRLTDVLAAATLIGAAPQAVCVGIQVADMSPAELTIGLSAPVEAALPRAAAAVLHLLAERDIAVRERPDAPADAAALRAAVSAALADLGALDHGGDE